MNVRPLPPKASVILSYLHRYRRAQGYWPSIKDITQGLSISSTSVTSRWLRRAEAAGWLSRLGKERTARCYHIEYQKLVFETTGGVATVWERYENGNSSDNTNAPVARSVER